MADVPAPGAEPAGRLASDIRDEAARLGAAMLAGGVAARLMGGLAIWLRCPSARADSHARDYVDLDFAATTRSVAALKAILEAEGYLPDKFFNGLHGATRLYYGAPDGRWSIDVVIDHLDMSHRLDLRERLDQPTSTIPLADLLLTKLQVWEINRKDLIDALCVLADHALVEDDRDAEDISVPRIRAVLGADWGFCHTVERNLGKVADLWAEHPLAAPTFDVAAQVAGLRSAISSAPKSLAWKARARVGERVRWYETPEEVGHH
jgi:hypothetical protein